jgi:Ca-activated chloride channel family protein
MSRHGSIATLSSFLLVVTMLQAQEPAPRTPVAPPAAPATPENAPAAARQTNSGTQPAFRGGVEVVSLNVTVMDSGRYVTDLTQSDFSVFEDGVKQEITFFNRAQSPIALALLLDTSASMEERLHTAQEAAVGFARRLRSEDLAEVVDFDSRVDILQAFTNNRGLLETAIRQTTAGGSTALHNAIYISLKELKKVKAGSTDDIRRQAIVVLSDGEDTSSVVSFEEVLDLAKRSETAIYCIGLRSKETTSVRGFKEPDFVLRQLAQETGGRAFFVNEVAELGTMYAQISDELSNQYTMGYTSNNPKLDGAWRRVVVRVNRPSVTTRTKMGYYAPKPRS